MNRAVEVLVECIPSPLRWLSPCSPSHSTNFGIYRNCKKNRKSADFKIVTNTKPTEDEIKDLKFAWIVSKHTKSNAIIFAKNAQTLGIGAGQMSRIDSVMIAKDKFIRSQVNSEKKDISLKGSVLSSDAFFPFSDTVISAAEAGVSAIIQPGGSIRDNEVIAEANKRNISMIFTSMRHFRH